MSPLQAVALLASKILPARQATDRQANPDRQKTTEEQRREYREQQRVDSFLARHGG